MTEKERCSLYTSVTALGVQAQRRRIKAREMQRDLFIVYSVMGYRFI
jgi:hypothetical protein